jgi:carboxylate-amine ligase
LLNIPCAATEAVQALLAHVRPALAETGDEEHVTAELARILAAGTGARRQREVMLSSQSLTAVVLDAIELTHGTTQWQHHAPGRFQTA